MITYRFAQREDLPQIAHLLTESFKDYPYLELYAPKGKKRNQFHEVVQQVDSKVGFKYEIILIGIENEQIVSVATLEAPHKKHAGLFAYIQAGGLKVIRVLGIKKSLAFLEMLDCSSKACKETYSNAWYISSLAVDHSVKGNGVGSSLITEGVIPNIKKLGGRQITLTTNTEQNCQFYKKNGFHLFKTEAFDVDGTVLWSWSFVQEIDL